MAVQNASNLTCYLTKQGLYIIPTFTVAWTMLFFPLCFLVLYVGFQRWRQNKQSPMSHTDFFTYNMLFIELLNISGNSAYSYGSVYEKYWLIIWGTSILSLVYPAQLSFHIFTCIERYLAVVHPVTYLNLRKRRWIWARNMTVLFAWMYSSLWLGLSLSLQPNEILTAFMILLLSDVCIVVFCSVSVLCTLRNPSPGEGSGVCQSKQKAFYTIFIILAVLMLWLMWTLLTAWLVMSNQLDFDLLCTLKKSMCWFAFPSSLVLPVLFLHRAGKLPKCGGNKSIDTGLKVITKM